MADLGDPTSYLELAEGVPVISSDGQEVGTVTHVLYDSGSDIFDGLVIKGDGGHRFVDSTQVEALYERGAVLTVDAAAAQRLPEPSENPPAMGADPADVEPDGLGDKLRKAWDRISGNY